MASGVSWGCPLCIRLNPAWRTPLHSVVGDSVDSSAEGTGMLLGLHRQSNFYHISITSYYSISSVSTHARGKSLAAVAVCPVSGAGSPATRYSRPSSIHAAYDNDSFHTCAEREFIVFQDIFSGCIQHCPTHMIAWT